jgi:hypothetical protein
MFHSLLWWLSLPPFLLLFWSVWSMIHTVKPIIGCNGYYISGDCDSNASTWSMLRKALFRCFPLVVRIRFQYVSHGNKYRENFKGRNFRLLAFARLIYGQESKLLSSLLCISLSPPFQLTPIHLLFGSLSSHHLIFLSDGRNFLFLLSVFPHFLLYSFPLVLFISLSFLV